MAEQESPVWFITGCSSGFGRELAKAVLGRGWRVVATARDPGKIADLAAGQPDRAVALALDVTRPEEIEAAVGEAMARFGRIDALVNNAGYGYASTIEEGEDASIRALFDTNVFGLAAMIRKVLPILRRQGSGTIINLSSQAGLSGYPGTGYYAASKFAVEGLSDALGKEVEPLGIRVLLVEPGPFRTSFTGSIAGAANVNPDYEQTAGARIRRLREGLNRPGDPARAAEAIIMAATAEVPPKRLLLGANALRDARAKIALMARDFDAWEQVTLDADYPEFRAAAQ